MDPKISSCQCRRVVFGSHFVFNSRREDSNMVFSKMRSTILNWEIAILLALIYEVKGDTESCPAGKYREEGDSQPRCRDCPEGTYSSIESNATYCEDCRREGDCPIGTVFQNTCSSTADNRCDCRDGYYWKGLDAYDGRCYMHRTCKKNQVVLKKGTPTEDTVCGPKPTGPTSTREKESDSKTYATTTTRIPDSTSGAKKESHELTDGGVAGIIIAIIMIIGLVLLIYYICSRQNDNFRPETQLEQVKKLNEKVAKKLKKRKNRKN